MNGLDNRKRVLLVEYDFAKDGGAVGDITLRGGKLPAGAVVTSGVIDVQTAVTGGTNATGALKVETANDVYAAAAVTSGWTAGLKDTVPVGAAAAMIKTTAASAVVLTVGTAALTAGKFVVALEYYITTE